MAEIQLFRKLQFTKEFINVETHIFPTSYLKNENPFLDGILKTGIEIV